MSGLDFQLPAAFDPFAEANANNFTAGAKGYVHVRVQQRNGRKSLTTVQGLKKEFSYNKILKDLKKEFCCKRPLLMYISGRKEELASSHWLLGKSYDF